MTDKTHHPNHEPFVRIVKRGLPSAGRAAAVRAASLGVALLLCCVYILIVGHNENVDLISAFTQMWRGTFGIAGNKVSMQIKMWDTGYFAAKLLCVSAALTLAFRMKFWNIGAEGQMVMGGLAAGILMHDYGLSIPRPLLLVLIVLTSVLSGAVWGLLPAVFKAKWGTNETLFTLMMNYVAMKIMDYFYNLWKGKLSSLPIFAKETRFPTLFGQDAGWSILIFIVLSVLLYIYLNKTKQGYEIVVIGDSANTARYAGINVSRVIMRTMAISGAICGLCGGLAVAAKNYCIASSADAVHSVTDGYGFTAIIVAWLANFNLFGMIGFSLLIQFLQKGTSQLGNKYTAFSVGAGDIMVGIVLFCIIGGAFFLNYKLVFRKSSSRQKSENTEVNTDNA